MSDLTPSRTRWDLLNMRRRPLAYGRKMLCAAATAELARRLIDLRTSRICSMARVERLDRVLIGRRQQVIRMIEEISLMENAVSYAAFVDEIAHLRQMLQSYMAMAAMNEVISNEEVLNGQR